MPNATDIAKKGIILGIDATWIAVCAAKYGVHIGFGGAKIIINGAESMANTFTEGHLKVSLGSKAFGFLEDESNKIFDFAIKKLKDLKGRV